MFISASLIYPFLQYNLLQKKLPKSLSAGDPCSDNRPLNTRRTAGIFFIRPFVIIRWESPGTALAPLPARGHRADHTKVIARHWSILSRGYPQTVDPTPLLEGGFKSAVTLLEVVIRLLHERADNDCRIDCRTHED